MQHERVTTESHVFAVPAVPTILLQPNNNIRNVSRSPATGGKGKNQAAAARRGYKKRLQNFLQDVILIQDILHTLGSSSFQSYVMRRDFLSGRNGAPRFSDNDFKTFMVFYKLLSTGREVAGTFTFEQLQEPQFQQASQHFAALMEGKVSNIPGTDATYSYLKWMITRIIKSGYFDRIREETAMATSDVLRNIAPAPARIDQDSGATRMTNA